MMKGDINWYRISKEVLIIVGLALATYLCAFVIPVDKFPPYPPARSEKCQKSFEWWDAGEDVPFSMERTQEWLECTAQYYPIEGAYLDYQIDTHGKVLLVLMWAYPMLLIGRFVAWGLKRRKQ